jgi:hypothetical protein
LDNYDLNAIDEYKLHDIEYTVVGAHALSERVSRALWVSK